MTDVMKVGMADLGVASKSKVLTTLGLGSCIGVTLYDPITKVGGLAHIMLPSSTQIKNNINKAKFADTGVEELLVQMIAKGASKTRIVAKMAGGAQMFEFKQMNQSLRIGARNIEAVSDVLIKHNIPVIASDVGGNYGRSLEFYLETGCLRVKIIGHGIKDI